MNGQDIKYILNSHPLTHEKFLGVFSSDTIPLKPFKRPSGCVVNLDKSHDVGSHWIATYFPETGPSEYYCSYGLAPHIKRILSCLGTPYKYNSTQIQGLLSTVCGQHCLFFIYCRCVNYEMEEILEHFGNYDLKYNDYIVNEYIDQTFGVQLPVRDNQYLYSQITRAFLQ